MRRRSSGSSDEQPSTSEAAARVSFLPPDDDDDLSSEHERLLGATHEPTDRRNLVYIAFFILGMGTLLPWNFFIAVNDFWDYKFRNVNDTGLASASHKLLLNETQTELQKEFTSLLSIASNVPNATFVILNALFGQRFSLRLRLYLSLGLIIGFFGVVTIFSRTDSDHWQNEFLYLVLTLVVLINVCTAIYQGGVFGVAGKFPPSYMAAVMNGQAMGGIFPALVNILVISVHVAEKEVGFSCFLVATLFLMLAFGLFVAVRRSPFFKYYSEETSLSASRDSLMDDPLPEPPSPLSSMMLVFSHSWVYCLGVFITFATTLGVFPAVTVLIESQYKDRSEAAVSSPWPDKYFTPVTCFLLFNCGDYFGRMAAGAWQWPRRNKKGQYTMLAMTVARMLFIPLFMFCNAAPTKRSLPVFIHSDVVYILIMLLFALSNGFLGNNCMLHGPKTFDADAGDPVSLVRRMQEATAMLLVACLVLGTGVGSFISYAVIKLL